MNSSSQIRVGLIGVGRIGKLHIEHLVQNIPEVELVTICSLNRPVAESVAEQYNVPMLTTDYNTVLSDSQIDAVLVTSSTNTHVEISQAAAKAGKHIFCEKPSRF